MTGISPSVTDDLYLALAEHDEGQSKCKKRRTMGRNFNTASNWKGHLHRNISTPVENGLHNRNVDICGMGAGHTSFYSGGNPLLGLPTSSRHNMFENRKVNNFARGSGFGQSQNFQNSNELARNVCATENSHDHEGTKRFARMMGYKRLQRLSTFSSTEIISELIKSHNDLQDLLKSNLKPDFVILIVKILAKACDCAFQLNKSALLSSVCQSQFLDQVEQHLFRMPTDQSPQRKSGMGDFIRDLLTFFESVMNILPNTASEKLKNLLIHTDVMMNGVTSYHGIDLKEQKQHFSKLNSQLQNMVEERERKVVKVRCEDELLKYGIPPDNFREKSVYPTSDDLFSEEKPFIRPNITEGAFLNVEHYLDIQFRLLREDFVGPLREGLKQYLEESCKRNERKRVVHVRIYQNVTFGNPKIVSDQIGLTVYFNQNKKQKINWEYSKRFMFGSLLLFTNDNFKHVVFGTVLERDINCLKNGEICVVVHEGHGVELFGSEFLMIESEVYFEPYKHVMMALQKLDSTSFPMEKYIISVKSDGPPPRYLLLSPESTYKMDNYEVQVLNENSWPGENAFGLDRSQMVAFKAALTQEFVVIQGPPGTGKTFLGLKIAKVLLENSEVWNNSETPILVVCFTNHALDQFLEGLVPVTNEIVRVGGQSKSDIITKYNLREKRKSFSIKNTKSILKKQIHLTMARIMKTVKKIQTDLEELENNRGIVSLRTLKEKQIITHEQEMCFGNTDGGNDQMKHWLFEGIDDFYAGAPGTAYNYGIGAPHGLNTEENLNMELDEEEIALQSRDYDPVLFDFGDISHSLQYVVDFREFDSRGEQLCSVLQELKSAPFSYTVRNLLRGARREYYTLQRISNYWRGCLAENHSMEPQYIRNLKTVHNLWQLSWNDRWSLYKDWLYTLKINLRNKIYQLQNEYRMHAHKYEEVKQFCDVEILKNSLVVGMTTTNAARLQTLLKELKPRVVIVEEAAEVLESHIVVSLTNKCEHVILIGDHKQLRPATAVYNLARRYHFDVSLFERMVKNGMQCHCLENQHRMRPEIAQLIVPTIYPDLKNDLSVHKYPPVRGISTPLFFVTHNVHEEEAIDMSHKNDFEADFILALCRHLIWQGYHPDEITILTTYKGQMFEMKKKQKKTSSLMDVKITVVDNYQGEENKIILLSLVRSNEEANIGFLKIENRVCVALSRAREAFYIVGNMDNLVLSSKIWPCIKETLAKQQCIGPHLTLQCQNHPEQLIEVKCAEDFTKSPEGGCSLPCEGLLTCGHKCESVCHANNREHKEYKCYKNCERIPPECALEHPCPKLCHEVCGKCGVMVARPLPCGHTKDLKCHMSPEEYECLEFVKVDLPNCGHTVHKPCFHDVATYRCPFLCPDRLSCGHSCTLKCHVLKDPDHLEFKCVKKCAKTNAGCTMNHSCKKLCYEECENCAVEVKRKLLGCNHVHKMKCSGDPALIECKRNCNKTLPCGHPCPKICFEDCGGCQVQVKKQIQACGHEVKVKCCEIPGPSQCKGPCQRPLPCGHRCPRRCGQTCITECRTLIQCTVQTICGHQTKIPCYLSKQAGPKSEAIMKFCQEPCGKVLECGHVCKGSCGQCLQGRIHIACSEDCNRNLICGHQCRVPCAKACPPCRAMCQYECRHSRCSRKCGVPCAECKEKCGWRCEHLQCTNLCYEICNRTPCYEPCKKRLRCGHACIGFCGEPCPPLCKICDRDEVTETFFGTEEEDDARFVFLVDCKHTFESQSLEKWLQQSESEIALKTCPKCSSQIVNTQRFMNYIKQALKKVSLVKYKIFGDRKMIEQERTKLAKCLYDFSKDTSLHSYMMSKSRFYVKLFQMCVAELKSVKNQFHNDLSEMDIQSLKSEIEIFKDILNCINSNIVKQGLKLKEEIQKRVFQHCDRILGKITRSHGKLSSQETSDFNRECKRFLRAIQLAVIESSTHFQNSLNNMEVQELHRKANVILNSLDVYSEKNHIELKSIIENLRKNVGFHSVLTECERKEILQAMSLRQGHWFACPNNHVYCIADCGGAVSGGKCPECGVAIGGSSYRLNPGNRLAPEMDGATRHAYPGNMY